MSNSLTGALRNAKSELAKVIFPTKGQVKQAFFAVFLVVTVISIFLALVDLLMSTVLSAILG
ncbi:MAG: preprotein translocase subunit SecE [Thiovulaceae bacterium]|nr:preprotein translocase subunit SecE [Sulfurimonadaceae bacterium]